jgi:hypothetical protein
MVWPIIVNGVCNSPATSQAPVEVENPMLVANVGKKKGGTKSENVEMAVASMIRLNL